MPRVPWESRGRGHCVQSLQRAGPPFGARCSPNPGPAGRAAGAAGKSWPRAIRRPLRSRSNAHARLPVGARAWRSSLSNAFADRGASAGGCAEEQSACERPRRPKDACRQPLIRPARTLGRRQVHAPLACGVGRAVGVPALYSHRMGRPEQPAARGASAGPLSRGCRACDRGRRQCPRGRRGSTRGR